MHRAIAIMRRHARLLIGITAVCSLLSGQAYLQARADEDTGSLDSMWMSEPGQQGKNATPPQHPPAQDPEAAEQAGTPPSSRNLLPASGTSAPMCSFETFKASAIVTRGGWPGVGPFKPRGEEPSELIDDGQNLLKVAVIQNQVTKAELNLVNRRPSGQPQQDLLDMQMTVDFLLEAVGIKPKKIADLNQQLEKNKEILLKGDGSPLNLTTGRYLVTIEKHRLNDSAPLFDYAISVNSLDASKTVIKEHSGEEPQTVKTLPAETTENPTPTSIASTLNPRTTPTPTTSAATAAADPLKEQFAGVIRDWQKIKKGAVRSRQTEELASVLSGKALIRQSDAVKWLVNNHKYYEMNPKGVIVDRYTEITPARKYFVYAQVKEASKFIDDASGQVLKESDDTYKVNYTIEKVAGHWLITDSALLSTSPAAQSNKGTSTKAR